MSTVWSSIVIMWLACDHASSTDTISLTFTIM